MLDARCQMPDARSAEILLRLCQGAVSGSRIEYRVSGAQRLENGADRSGIGAFEQDR